MSPSAKPLFPLKPTSAHVKKYYETLAFSHKHGHTTEGNTRFAFEELLRRCVSPYGWHVVPEYAFKGTDKQPLRADGALVDDFTVVHGIWEAKNSDDDLTKEVGLKFKKATLSPISSSSPPATPSSIRTAATTRARRNTMDRFTKAQRSRTMANIGSHGYHIDN